MAEILVVDDEPLLRSTLRHALEIAGHSVKEAANGVEALAAVSRQRPAVVILDILMPEKEGIETILDLRRKYDGIKIIAMSGGGRVGDTAFLAVAQRLGADRVIAKPFNRDQLLNAVDDVLGLRRTP